MNDSLLDVLATLRATVGYLGEREQFGWWQSSFFSSMSGTFLKPVFGKTALMAQCQGVTQAAARVHDVRIGVGDVYHLFRLPEDMEQRVARVLLDLRFQQRLLVNIASTDAALELIRATTAKEGSTAVGPVYIGDSHMLRDESGWSAAAGHYVRAFEGKTEAYPYFADRT